MTFAETGRIVLTRAVRRCKRHFCVRVRIKLIVKKYKIIIENWRIGIDKIQMIMHTINVVSIYG